jgi:hypothetical protein
MNALKAPILILGYLASLLGLSALYDAPDASEGILEAPSASAQPYEYLEAPLAVLTASTTSSTTTTTTVPVTTTTAWKQPELTSACHQALQVALNVGWPPAEMAKLARVLWRESRCGPKSFNPDDPMGGSHGIMQLNSYWCKPVTGWPKGWLQARRIIKTCDDLYNRETNLRAGLAIWLDYGWEPWGM